VIEIDQAHPLHKTFLHFFSALCYESLGLIAHNYSSQKIPYLNLAKDAFALASSTLPAQFTSDGLRNCDSPTASPMLREFEFTSSEDNDRSAIVTTVSGPTASIPHARIRRTLSAGSSLYSQRNELSISSEVAPSFYERCRQQSILDIDALANDLMQQGVSQETEKEVTVKLTPPKINNELLPEPLFIVKRPTKVDALDTLWLPPVKPLILSQRQTALLATPNPNFLSPAPSAESPTPKPTHESLQAYLSSRSLARYNNELASFRTQLFVHITAVEETIIKTTSLQKEHKANKFKRLASYWSFKAFAPGEEGEDQRSMETKERIERLKKSDWRVTKEQHGWKGDEHYAGLRRKAEIELEKVKREPLAGYTRNVS